MRGYDPDFDLLFILDALDAGIVPNARSARELVAMGFLERAPTGRLVLTLSARVKLCELRARLATLHALRPREPDKA